MKSRENNTALGNYPGRRTPTPLAMAILNMQNRNLTQSFGTDQDWQTPVAGNQRYDGYDKGVDDSEQVMDQHMDLDVPLASPKTEDQNRDQEVELQFPEINQRRGQEFIEAATNYPWLMDIEKQ